MAVEVFSQRLRSELCPLVTAWALREYVRVFSEVHNLECKDDVLAARVRQLVRGVSVPFTHAHSPMELAREHVRAWVHQTWQCLLEPDGCQVPILVDAPSRASAFADVEDEVCCGMRAGDIPWHCCV